MGKSVSNVFCYEEHLVYRQWLVIFVQPFMQASSLYVLLHYIELLRGYTTPKQLDNVWVMKLGQYVHLLLKCLEKLIIVSMCNIQHFNSYQLSLPQAFVYHAKRASPYDFLEIYVTCFYFQVQILL